MLVCSEVEEFLTFDIFCFKSFFPKHNWILPPPFIIAHRKGLSSILFHSPCSKVSHQVYLQQKSKQEGRPFYRRWRCFIIYRQNRRYMYRINNTCIYIQVSWYVIWIDISIFRVVLKESLTFVISHFFSPRAKEKLKSLIGAFVACSTTLIPLNNTIAENIL